MNDRNKRVQFVTFQSFMSSEDGKKIDSEFAGHVFRNIQINTKHLGHAKKNQTQCISIEFYFVLFNFSKE